MIPLKKTIIFSVIIWSVLIHHSCQKTTPIPPPVQGEWIKGTEAKKLQTIEKQFRGFDMAMVETGYRYQELYWAGQDENWEYAAYQVEKIKKAIENGLERRPKRAQSAQHFLQQVLPGMKVVINQRNKAGFEQEFDKITVNCNQCHTMEKVPFFKVQKPTQRISPIH
ncbi:hypothetical protein UJ101_01244 [Flavobacteriaceae bacterium UJ101]|nr:hypothetical protein UJ101_01244 [Flavobacteriaceae bacterium UJ101]